MTLTTTAARMSATLPAYYEGEPLIERIVQARANEVDRADEVIDRLRVELIPGQATDRFGLLGMWETQVDLPANPQGATVGQRQSKVNAALRALDSGSSASVMATIAAAMGTSSAFTVYRDTPDPGSDTLEVPYAPGSYNGALVQQIVRRLWPAHRRLLMRYSTGFLLDASLLDQDSL